MKFNLDILTHNPSKRYFYAIDPHFREGWEDVVKVLGRNRYLERMPRLAALIMRSDLIAVSGGIAVLDWLLERGFQVHAFQTFKYTRIMIREAWRYQLNIATSERIAAMDMILTRCPSLYLLLSHPSPPGDTSTTTWLSSMKGPSAPEDRRNEHIRGMVDGPQASVMTYVHIPDEPADLVRDLGLMFSSRVRRRLIKAIHSDKDNRDNARSQVQHLQMRYGGQNLDFSTALNFIKTQLANQNSGKPIHNELNMLTDRLLRGESKDWSHLLHLARKLKLGLEGWQQVAIASVLAERHHPFEPVIPDIQIGEHPNS